MNNFNNNNKKKIRIVGEFEVPQEIYLNILFPILEKFCNENNLKFSGYIENTEYKNTETNKVTIF